MNKQDYDRLADIVFRLDSDGKPTYPGYRPDVKEIPHGDGQVDRDKRYAHVADKYLDRFWARDRDDDYAVLYNALYAAECLSGAVAGCLGVASPFWPAQRNGALRVLEYPVGATSNLHTDFDLFSLVLYRDQPDCLVLQDCTGPDLVTPQDYIEAAGQYSRMLSARKLNAQLHIGELGELIGLGPATPHEVIASDRPQHSAVYFALPNPGAVLPTGQTVGNWLEERMSRSRVEVKP